MTNIAKSSSREHAVREIQELLAQLEWMRHVSSGGMATMPVAARELYESLSGRVGQLRRDLSTVLS